MGLGDAGTWDAGSRGRQTRDSGTWDSRMLELGDSTRRMGTRGCDKQTTPDFCIEFAEKFNFWRLSVR